MQGERHKPLVGPLQVTVQEGWPQTFVGQMDCAEQVGAHAVAQTAETTAWQLNVPSSESWNVCVQGMEQDWPGCSAGQVKLWPQAVRVQLAKGALPVFVIQQV